MTLAEYYRSVRVLSQDQVDEIETHRSSLRGKYVPHEAHSLPSESRH